ncbi:low-density lipoprotein receptor class A domain-containing protein 2-like [Ptychodera flava]|uniref:low-density lipoprotein receptor class A domain-containing protein 2-like n=1 Tax=Ptychodera flava TaxID=63121 RepID=UPI00396A5694
MAVRILWRHVALPYGFVFVLVTSHLAAAEKAMMSACGETVEADGSRLVSQFSKNHEDKLDCVVTLEASENNQRILLTFDWIDLETYRDGCPDYLEIYDGAVMPSARPIKRFCGTFKPGDVASSSNILGLRLVTDGTKTRQGFSLVHTSFHVGDADSCNNTETFMCINQRCLNSSLHCNGLDNCGDLSDEWFCIDYLIKWSELQIQLFVVGVLLASAILILILCSVWYRFLRWYDGKNTLNLDFEEADDQLQLQRRGESNRHQYVPYTSLHVTRSTPGKQDRLHLGGSRHTI